MRLIAEWAISTSTELVEYEEDGGRNASGDGSTWRVTLYASGGRLEAFHNLIIIGLCAMQEVVPTTYTVLHE